MKKFKSVLLLVAVLLMTSSAFSLLRVEGTYSSFAKQAGYGIGVNFPLIPFLDTTLYYHMLGDANITATDTPSFGDFTLSAGATKINASAIELQAKLPFAIMDVAIGGSVLFDLGTIDSTPGIVPGSLYGGLYAHYQQGIVPMVHWFAQAGFLSKLWDGEKAINDEIGAGASLDMGAIDRSGMYFRVGIAAGL